ncbi:hypothetical protein pb186bvf_015929 [Paramecium bursaria]
MEEFQLIRTMGIQYQIHYFEIELEKQQSEENLIIQSIEINGWLHPTSFISFHFIQKYKLQPIMKKKTNTQICAHQLFKEKALKKLEIQNNQLEPDESSDGSDDSVEIEKKQENQFHSESSKSSFSLEIQEKQSDSDEEKRQTSKIRYNQKKKNQVDLLQKNEIYKQSEYSKYVIIILQILTIMSFKKQYRFLLIILDDPDYFQKKINIGFKHVRALIIQHFSQFFAVMALDENSWRQNSFTFKANPIDFIETQVDLYILVLQEISIIQSLQSNNQIQGVCLSIILKQTKNILISLRYLPHTQNLSLLLWQYEFSIKIPLVGFDFEIREFQSLTLNSYFEYQIFFFQTFSNLQVWNILPKEPFLKNYNINYKNRIQQSHQDFLYYFLIKNTDPKKIFHQNTGILNQTSLQIGGQVGKSGIFQRTFDIYIFFINSISGLIVQSINNSFLKIMIKAKPFFVHQTSFTIIKIPFRLQKQLHSFIFIKSIIIGLQQFNISVDQNSSGFHKLLLFNLNGLKFLSKVSNDIRSLKQKFKIPFADANFKRFSSPSIKFIKIISHHFI